MEKIKFECPKCGATPNEHGKGDCRNRYCMGFVCECDGDTAETHGDSYSDPCPNANCDHCGWFGKFPKPPGKILPWEKKALEAGWTPPVGWNKDGPTPA